MKVFSLFSIFLISNIAFAQTSETISLLKEHTQQNQGSTRLKLFDQFSDNCIYENKCGDFAKESIHEFGLLKGFMMSIDRRLRCNGLTKNQTPKIRFNQEGKVIDHVSSYRVKVD